MSSVSKNSCKKTEIIAEQLLAQCCNQVLANLKPANLFTVSRSKYHVDFLLKEWNLELNPHGIYFTLLSYRGDGCNILCYRKDALEACIHEAKCRVFLASCGYNTDSLDHCIVCMMRRMGEREFPHEIGLLLGYPYEDVMGFIENKGKNYLCSGYWKVYAKAEQKKQLFILYNEIRARFIAQVKEGVYLRDLIEV